EVERLFIGRFQARHSLQVKKSAGPRRCAVPERVWTCRRLVARNIHDCLGGHNTRPEGFTAQMGGI
ncbi:MAG: hypothetical protein MUC34_19100, partial [Anaerolineae bacterium]|nr:hypothetical protein [Anaerolineae bacterium]